MYTFEERMKPVELCIQSGRSEGTVIRTLGYPSQTEQRNWYKEYLSKGNLRTGSAPKSRYTQEQKVAQVEYYTTNHTALNQTYRALGDSTRYVLRQWLLAPMNHPKSGRHQSGSFGKSRKSRGG